MADTKKVTGKLPNGDEGELEFALMKTKSGLRLMHEEQGAIMILVTLYEKAIEDGDDALTEGEFLATVGQSVMWEKIEKMTNSLLNGEFKPNLSEHYASLYYALIGNFEATINPLRAALADDEGDSTENSTQPEKASESAPTT